MKNIKEITISIFAIIGFFTIITGFTNNTETATQQTYGTPESHVWEAVGAEGSWGWLVNKKTGEVLGLDATRKARVIVKTIDKK